MQYREHRLTEERLRWFFRVMQPLFAATILGAAIAATIWYGLTADFTRGPVFMKWVYVGTHVVAIGCLAIVAYRIAKKTVLDDIALLVVDGEADHKHLETLNTRMHAALCEHFGDDWHEPTGDTTTPLNSYEQMVATLERSANAPLRGDLRPPPAERTRLPMRRRTTEDS